MARIRKPYKKRTIPAHTRRAVALAAGAVPGETTDAPCTYCGVIGNVHWPQLRGGQPGAWVSLTGLEFDHVFPESLGGSSLPENVVLACRKCNRAKRDKVL
jgi:5-methylcytosine-specific restriction endonuclease McrA